MSRVESFYNYIFSFVSKFSITIAGLQVCVHNIAAILNRSLPDICIAD